MKNALKKLAGGLALASLATLTITAAHAAEQSTDLQVTGQVVNACTIETSPVADFGTMTKDETQTLAGPLRVTCGAGVAYTVRPHDTANVAVSGTKNGSALSLNPLIAGNASIDVGLGTLSFFRDAGATTAWSDQPADKISATGTGSEQVHEIAFKFVHNGTDYGSFSVTLRPTVGF